jgi:transposase
MPPAYVKPYVKRQKNDAADAICEAVTRATMRFVETKTPEQQSRLMLHRTRHRYIPGTGMISMISIHAPGICRWGWSLPNTFVAASCDSACTTE